MVSTSSIPNANPSARRQRLLFALLTFSSLTSGGTALAAGAPLPTGGQFVAGTGAISAATNGLKISQSSTTGIINWQTFSIAAGQTVNIANGAGATLNRVTGGDLSSIAGSLKATGSVYVVNPAGVVVMPGGKVMTGGSFVASSRDVSNSAFMAGGDMTLSGTSSGTVVNQGTITSANGDVVLVGKSVTNSGDISAAKGTAALAAGDNVLLQASGDDAVLVNAGTGDVTNSGTIAAAQVELNAVGGNVYALATNDGGVIRATGTTTKAGHVYLTGGDNTTVDGAVSATNVDGSGGEIVATAANVTIGTTAKISANGKTKGGGTILIGGDRHGGTDPSVALSKTPVANATTTTVAAGATISADAGTKGSGGNVVVWSDQTTNYSGAISAKGGMTSGNGGFVEVSSEGLLNFVGTVTTAAAHGANGTLLLDPSDVTIVDNSGSYTNNSGNVTTTVNYTVPNPTTNETLSTSSGATTYTPTGAGGTSAPGNNSSYILNTNIETALLSNNVIITTSTNPNTLGTANGDILIAAPIVWNSSHSLTLSADNTIKFANTSDVLTSQGSGGISLNAAGSALAVNSSADAITIGADITANGGTISINATAPVNNFTGNIGFTNGPTITNTTGDIDLVTTAYITVNANLSTTVSGNINLVAGPESLITIGNGFKVQTAGVGSVLLESDFVSLGSSPEPGETGQVITDATLGKVTIQPVSDGPIEVGSRALDGVQIVSDQDLALITTHTLVIGSNGATAVNGFVGGQTTGITVTDNLNSNSKLDTTLNDAAQVPLANVGNLSLVTSSTGFVTENSSSGNFAIAVHGGTGGLAVSAGTYIDLGNAGNQVGTLALGLTGTGVVSPTGTGNSSIQFKGDPSSGSLTIGTVDTVSGITATGVGSVYLSNAGIVTQDTSSAANKITAASLDLEGGTTAAYTLNNTSNAIGSIAGKFASLSLYNNIDLTTATIGSTAGLNGTGDITVVDNGNLTIANLAALTTTGGNVRLEDQTFTNSDAGNAFSVAGGGKTWRVYSQNPLNDSNNDSTLTYGFVQYNAANSYATPFTTADAALDSHASGNGFLYTVAPTAKESFTGNLTKQYDGTTAVTQGLTSSNYSTVTYTYGASQSFAAQGDTVTFSNPTGTGNIVYDSPHAGTRTVTGVPTLTITSAHDANNVPVYGYQQDITNSLTGSITAAPLVITGTKTYDGTSGFTATQLAVASGGITGDTVTIATGSTGTAKSAGAPIADQGTYNGSTIAATITVSGTNGSLASDYSVPTTGSLTITPIMLTVSGTKVYDGTATADHSTFTTPISGELSADVAASDVTLVGSGTVTGSNAPNVGSYSTTGGTFSLGTLALQLTGAQMGKGNYVLSGATYTVTMATLTVAAASGSRNYDGTTNVPSADITSVSGLASGDTFGTNIGISGTGSVTSANAGAYNATGTGTGIAGTFSVTGLMLTGADAGNYTLAAGTFTITPLPITVTGTRHYDGNTNASSTLLTVTDAVGSDVVGLGGTGAVTSANASGTPYALTSTSGALTGLTVTNPNYTTTGGSGTFTITPLPITVSGTRNYDGSTNASSTVLTVTDAVGSDIIGLGGTGTVSSPHASTTPYALTTSAGALSGLTVTNTNYTTTGGSGTFTITPLPITVSGTRDYNGTTSAASNLLTVTDTVGSDVVGLGGTGAVSSANASSTPYALTSTSGALTGLTVTNTDYTTTGGTGTFTITPLPITVSGTRHYDGSTNASSTLLTVTDAVGNDVVGLGGTGTVSGPHASTTPYALTTSAGALSGLTVTNTNYTTTGGSGTFTITPLPITVSGTRNYNGTTAAASNLLTVTDTVGSDVVGLGGTGAVSSANASSTPYALTSTSGALTGLTVTNTDYTTTGGTGTFTITPLPITVSGTRHYDGNTDASSTLLTVTDAVGNDVIGLGGTGAVTSANASSTPYALTSTSGSLTGLTVTNTNYTTTGGSGTFTITPLPITVSGTRNYDGSTNASSTLLTVTDAVGNDVVGLGGTGTVSGPHASSTPYALTTSAGALAGLTVTNTNYTTTGGTGAFTITPLPITVSGTRDYNGTTSAASNLLTVTDTVGSDVVGLGGTGAVSSANASTTPYALTSTSGALTGLTVTNTDYTTTGGAGAFTITPLPITVSGTRHYDGSTNASSTALTVTDAVGSDVVGLGGTGAVTSANASGTPYALTSTSGALTGLTVTNANYTTTGGSGTFTITPLPITVSGTRHYDGSTNASSTVLTVTDAVGSDIIGLGGTGTVSSPHASTTPYALTTSAGALSGLTVTNTNYTTTGGSGTFTITPLPITVSGTRDYNGTTSAASNLLTVTDTVGSDVVGLGGTGAVSSANASSTPYALTSTSGALTGLTVTNTDYTTTGASGTFTITPLPVTLTGTRVYDGMTDAAGSILMVTNDLDGGNLTVGGTGVLASKNVGGENLTSTSGTLTGLTLGGSASGNYTLTGGSGSVTVTKATLTIAAVTQTRVYDGATDSSGTPTVTGLQTGDTISATPLIQAYQSKNVLGTNGSTLFVTNFTSVSDGNGGGNYNVVVNTAPGTITPEALTVTATPTTKTYDGTSTSSGTPTVTAGTIYGPDTGTFTQTYGNPNAGTGLTLTPTGTISDTNGGNNYTVTYVPVTTGIINKAPLTIDAVTQTRVYDGATDSSGVPTYTGLVGSDTLTGLSQAYQSKNVLGTNGSTLAVNTGYTLSDPGNYSVTLNTAMGTITPEALTVTATPTTKTYDGTSTSSGTPTVTAGTIYGPDTGTFTQTYGSPNAGTGLTLTPTGTISDTNGGNNYTLTFVPVTTGVINKAPLTIDAVTQTRVYDGATDSSGVPTYTGLVGSDTLTGLSQGYLSRNVLGINGSTLKVNSGYTLSDPGNYSVTLNTAPGTITPELLTVTATPTTKTYNGTPTSTGTPTVTSGTIFGPDTGTFTETYNTPHAGTGLTLTPTGTLTDGNGGGNYTVVYVPVATGVINPEALTISAVTQTRVYDGATDSSGTPVITAGALGTGDTLTGLSQAYLSRNVLGTNGSTLKVNAGYVLTDASDYNVTLLTAPGTITPEPLTVTATPTTKTFDGTPTSPGTPTVTTGTIYGPDTGTFTQVYNTPHAGTGLTLTPTGTLTDGNDGGNYTVTYVPVATGVISPEALTISAVTQTRVYDGATDSSGTPVITAGVLENGDTLTGVSQAYLSRNVLGTNGSTLKVNAGYVLTDATDYSVTLATSPGTITPEAITVTAIPTTKTYDGTPTSPGTPTVTAGTIFGPDIGTFTQAYNMPNAGSGLTLTPTGMINDGNGGNNYTVTFAPVTTGLINPKAVILTGTRPFDSTTSAASPILKITDLIPGDVVTLGGTGTLISPAVGNEAISSFTGLSLGGAAAGNYTFVGATGTVIVTPATVTNIAEVVTVPSSQTASGAGESVTFAAYAGGILTLTPKRNGIVTGTIATIDGAAYNADTQLGCTIGAVGCIQNGVATAPSR